MNFDTSVFTADLSHADVIEDHLISTTPHDKYVTKRTDRFLVVFFFDESDALLFKLTHGEILHVNAKLKISTGFLSTMTRPKKRKTNDN